MCQTCTHKVTAIKRKHLCFILQTTKRCAKQNSLVITANPSSPALTLSALCIPFKFAGELPSEPSESAGELPRMPPIFFTCPKLLCLSNSNKLSQFINSLYFFIIRSFIFYHTIVPIPVILCTSLPFASCANI